MSHTDRHVDNDDLLLEHSKTIEELDTTTDGTPAFVNLAHVQSIGDVSRRSLSQTRTRESVSRRRRSSVRHSQTRDQARSSSIQPRSDIDDEAILSLTKSVSQISGHAEAYRDSERGRHAFPRWPQAAKTGGFDVIKELPTPFDTPYASRRPSPNGRFDTISRPSSPVYRDTSSDVESLDYDSGTENELDAVAYPDVGTISSWRGGAILICVCGAQLMDNIFMTGVNISLPAIQREFNVSSSELQWLISAYTLTFGGFLLLAGVLADRYGRKQVFCAGMVFLSIWTLANGFATSLIQMAIFRALQGIGAAATVPSSVGIISSFFVAKDRSRGLSIFGAAGAVGFCVGLVLGGLLTASIGWRYLFYLSVAITGTIPVIGWFILPNDRRQGQEKPKLDFAGVGLSATGLILLSFVLSSGGEYGWSKAFIIVLLVASVALLVAFTWVEKKVPNPIMPLSLWKLKNFAVLWISGFMMYGSYQTIIYYTTLIAQEVQNLSASQTAVRFLPMGATGFCLSMLMGTLVDRVNTKVLLLIGMLLSTLAPVSAAIMPLDNPSFWTHILPATILGVAGVTIGYCTITVVLLSSVPDNVKSLCAGMINTAYQIGSGVALALSTAVVQAVDVKKGHPLLTQYETGLWCCVGFGALSLISAIGIKNVSRVRGSGPISMH